MKISNISLQYNFYIRLKIIYNLTHSILVVLLFLKLFNPFLQKSTRHFKTEKKHLTLFDGV